MVFTTFEIRTAIIEACKQPTLKALTWQETPLP
jgi:hypothetical protein